MDTIAPTIPEAPTAGRNPGVDPRLYGDFGGEPAVKSVQPTSAPTSASPEPSTEGKPPLDLTYRGGSTGQIYPSFGTNGQRGAHGHLTGAFVPATNTPKITIQAQSPGTPRIENPNEIGKEVPGTTSASYRPPSGNRPSFAEESSNRINAATTERLPPRPQDAQAALNPAPPQRASPGRIAGGIATSVFNQHARPGNSRAEINMGRPPRRTEDQGGWTYSGSVSGNGRVRINAELRF